MSKWSCPRRRLPPLQRLAEALAVPRLAEMRRRPAYPMGWREGNAVRRPHCAKDWWWQFAAARPRLVHGCAAPPPAGVGRKRRRTEYERHRPLSRAACAPALWSTATLREARSFAHNAHGADGKADYYSGRSLTRAITTPLPVLRAQNVTCLDRRRRQVENPRTILVLKGESATTG